VLLAAAVLEHLKHADRLLRQSRELLKPGAKVIVSLPNVAHYSMRLRLLRGKFDYEDYGIMDRTHLHFYTLSTGKQLLEQEGYRVESVHIVGSGLQNLFNALSRRLHRPVQKPILAGLFAYEFIMVATAG
jgi:hypothetical protein